MATWSSLRTFSKDYPRSLVFNSGSGERQKEKGVRDRIREKVFPSLPLEGCWFGLPAQKTKRAFQDRAIAAGLARLLGMEAGRSLMT